MARGDSIIRVSIIGDAKKLVGALGQADQATGGLVKSIGGTLIALGAVREAFNFLGDSTKEADRLGDAITRLNIQLGPDFTSEVQKTASGFHDIGASSQDILELEANFADLGTTIGLTNSQIAGTAPEVAAIAFAVSQLEDVDPSTVIEQIGKAANGSAKAALSLGVSLIDTKDPAVQLANIMSQLKPKLDAVTAGSGDLERQQRSLQASVEELQGKIGGPLSDALATVVGFINDEVDAIPAAVEGWQMLGAAIEGFGRTALGPLGNVRDALAGILDLLGQAGDPKSFGAHGIGVGPAKQHALQLQSDAALAAAIQRDRERNGRGS